MFTFPLIQVLQKQKDKGAFNAVYIKDAFAFTST